MKIIQKFNEEDREKLEYMLSFQYQYDRYRIIGTRKTGRKILHILTPIAYILSLYMFVSRMYLIFIMELFVAVVITAWIIWYHRVGKKFEDNVHEVIYRTLHGEGVAVVDESGITYGKVYCKYDDIRNVIFYDQFLFVILNSSRFFIMKINIDERAYIKSLLVGYDNIVQEVKTEPFNFFTYLAKKKEK